MYVVFRNSDHLIQYTYLFLFINKTLYMPQEMVSSESKVSMIISGRGARACDMCGKERARWYCAADEAYLCEKCDGFVHSANAVARRHERVRLGPDGAPVKLKRSHGLHRKRTGEYDHLSLNFKTSPFPRKSKDTHKRCNSTKKWSRIPRKAFVSTGQSISAVIPTDNQESSKDAIPKEDANPLLYDLLTAEDQPGDLSTTDPLDIKVKPFSPSSTLTIREYHEIKAEVTDLSHEVPTYIMEKTIPSSPSLCNTTCNSWISTSLKPDFTSLHWDSECSGPKNEAGFPDAGPLCVNGAAEGSTGHDIHGSLSISEDSDIDMFDVMDLCSAANFDNVPMRDSREGFPEVDMWKDLHETNEASCNSVFEGKPFTGENELNVGCVNVEGQWPQNPVFQKPLWLSLDYEDVIFAWLDRGSLWVDGQRPQIVPDINPLDHGFGMMITNVNSTMGSQAGQVPSIVVIDRAREARVLRYKEKRLTRLVSKKIRYEVRKLNADRRPRMKVQALLQEVLDKISIIATLRRPLCKKVSNRCQCYVESLRTIPLVHSVHTEKASIV